MIINEIIIHSFLECQTDNFEDCVFPFIYNGKKYNGCTKDHTTNNHAWCATAVSEDQVAIDNVSHFKSHFAKVQSHVLHHKFIIFPCVHLFRICHFND